MTDREILIAEIEAADLCSPEQVADLVLSALASDGIDAARAKLAQCVENDDA